MSKDNQTRKIDEIPLRIEKGKNYYLFNPEYFFKNFSSEEIEIIERILNCQKIDPLVLKDLIECEGILKHNPILQL